MAGSNIKFQCIMCFSINEITREQLGHLHTCTNCGRAMQLPNSSFTAGRVIADDFVIKRKLGAGAMGSVYLAHQLSMDREVALKVFFYQYNPDTDYAREFNEEAKIAARINHINIIQSLSFGADHDVLYMAMTYVNGETFEKLIKRHGKADLDDALNIVQQVAEGLHAAWTEQQMIHRDIKPANIIIADDGIAKISDFGLARRANEVNLDVISGSPAYMSPEQFGRKKLDCRSDIYSLGITLYEAIIGKLPFTGDSPSAVAYKHINEPLPIRDIRPRQVRELLKKMCEKDPVDRFSTPHELIARIVDIRKKIAVDKAAVAGVHTMSIRRHNFNEPSRKNLKSLSDYSHEISYKQHSEKHFRIQYFVIGLLLAIFALVALFVFSSPRQVKRSGTFEKSVGEIRDKISETETQYEKNQTKLLNQVLAMRDSQEKLQAQIDDLNAIKNILSTESDKIYKENVKTRSDLGKIFDVVKINQKGLASLTEKLQEEHKLGEILLRYRSSAWYKILNYTSRGDILNAKVFIEKELSENIQIEKEWLLERKNDLIILDRVVSCMEAIATEWTTRRLSDDRLITYSQKQNGFITKKLGKIEKFLWSDFSMEEFRLLFSAKWDNSIIKFENATMLYAFYTLRFSDALNIILNTDKKAAEEAMILFKDSFAGELRHREKISGEQSKIRARLLKYYNNTPWYEELKKEFPVELMLIEQEKNSGIENKSSENNVIISKNNNV